MRHEEHKAENSDEIVWLRLNRLKSSRLCENVIREKLLENPNPSINEELILQKAIGLSSAIKSAIGFFKTTSESLNAKVLSRYYFLLQMTIADQVSNTNNVFTLKEIQRHTEFGHGLATHIDNTKDFPYNFYIYGLKQGHFNSYVQSLGIDPSKFSFEKRIKSFHKLNENEINNIVCITDLFRRIPELSNVVEEYLKLPPLAFHVGYSFTANIEKEEKKNKALAEKMFSGVESINDQTHDQTYVSIYDNSVSVNSDYLKGLNLPFEEYIYYKESRANEETIAGRITHPTGTHWHQKLNIYSSSNSPLTLITPLWNEIDDYISLNLMLLYGLSIIVRYLPDIWHRIDSDELNHINSLIEYYITITDHTIPKAILSKITGLKVAIHQPGSFFGSI